MAPGDEFGLEGEVVLDDAVVDDDEGAGAVAVGVGVLFGGAAVGGPAGVADAEGAGDGALGEDGFEVAEFARCAAELECSVGAAGDGDAGRVVAAVFEAAQAFDDDGDGGIRANVSDDSTHGTSLDAARGFCEWQAMGLLGEERSLSDVSDQLSVGLVAAEAPWARTESVLAGPMLLDCLVHPDGGKKVRS